MYWIAKMSQLLAASSMVMTIIVLMMTDNVEGAMRSYFGPPPPPDPGNTDPYHWMQQAMAQIRKNCPGKSQTPTPPAPPDDPCIPNPCQYGGTCHPVNGTNTNYSCECVTHFCGEHCEIQENPCIPNPCQYGGTCQNGANSGYSCVCKTDFSGELCEIYGPCHPNPCDLGATCHPDNGSDIYHCKFYGTCQGIMAAGAFIGSEKYYIKPACDPSPDTIKVTCEQGTEGGGWMRMYKSNDGDFCSVGFTGFWTRGRIVCHERYEVGVSLREYDGGSIKTWALHGGLCGSLSTNLDFLIDLAHCQKAGFPHWSWGFQEVLVEGVCSTDANWGEISSDACGISANVHVNISVLFDPSVDNFGMYVLSCLSADSGEWIQLSQWFLEKREVLVKVDTAGPCESTPCQLGHTCRPVFNEIGETYTCEYQGPCNPSPCEHGGTCHPGSGTSYTCEYYESCQAIVNAGTYMGYGDHFINPVCEPSIDEMEITCSAGDEGSGWNRMYKIAPDECSPQFNLKAVCQETNVTGFSISNGFGSPGEDWYLRDGLCSSLSVPDPDFFNDIMNCLTPSNAKVSRGNEAVLVEGVCSIDTNVWEVSPETCGNTAKVNVSVSIYTDGNYGDHVMSCFNAGSGNWIKLGEKTERRFIWVKF